uniref:Uncharacterized protein n=1 Tax=Kalanchoe fedtschenkoi TaxID=63787 RepID=A0A7N0TBY6_KALFE
MEISSSSHNFTLSRNFGCAIRSQRKSKMPPSLPMPPAPVRRPAALCLKAATECGSCAPELMEMEEWREMLKWGDKCRGSSSGVVELLECLEREAIMGEDEGRDPVDYNRRARIFNTSSRVFQALKHQSEFNDNAPSQD